MRAKAVNEYKDTLSSVHSRVDELIAVMKTLTGPVQAQVRPNPSIERGDGHDGSSLVRELLPFPVQLRDGREGKAIFVDSLCRDHSPMETTHL